MVGPRPLLMRYLGRYTPEQACRHEVRPGLTGLAQVHGRNALTWEDKLALDVEYVRTRTLLLDLSITWRTVLTLVRSQGVTPPGAVSTAEFLGTAAQGPV